MENDFYSRPYSPVDDYDMVEEWWTAHHHPVVPVYHLPPVGFISGFDGLDMVAMWLRFDSHAPVCFIAHVVSLPGLLARETMTAALVGVEACKAFAQKRGMESLSIYAPRAIARYLFQAGFTADSRDLVNVTCPIRKEDLCLG